jgi:hypothetical protein
MKKRSNRITQHAPRTLQERELETIRGGDQGIKETIQSLSSAQEAGFDTQQEINRNLK